MTEADVRAIAEILRDEFKIAVPTFHEQQRIKSAARRIAARGVPEGFVLVKRDVLEKARISANMLLQNAIGCASNHYGDDHQIHGLPAWIRDCHADIDKLAASPAPTEENK